MAYPNDNGDISEIKPLGRFPIGGGVDLAGLPTQKVMVFGEITGKWVDTNGLKLNPKGGLEALGLKALDFISFEPRVTGTTGSKTYEVDLAVHEIAFDTTNNQILGVIDGATNVSQGDTWILGFIAVGDDASAPELT